MALLRLLRLIAHLLRGLLICATVFPRIGPAQREQHVRIWSRALLALCGVELRVIAHKEAALGAELVVANHVSWLDIFLINAVQPRSFVAKSEIRNWPLIGWLCEQVGTIFIARGRVRDVRRIYQGLVDALRSGKKVAFFPEGTVAEQGNPRPFHANLFEAAIEAGVPVQPVALRYLDETGAFHPAVRYVDPVTFLQSVWMIASSSGMIAEVHILPPLVPVVSTHRRELAGQAETAVAQVLSPERQAQSEPGARYCGQST